MKKSYNDNRSEYGDWQTNYDLALSVCKRLKDSGCDPQIIIEPTCGIGNFIVAALNTFSHIEKIYGIEIYKPYLDTLKSRLKDFTTSVELIHESIFSFDLTAIKERMQGKRILVIGNPPWVTNSALGSMDSKNLPAKSNFKSGSGIDAILGKANFDIAEGITLKMLSMLEGEDATLALLVKNSVVKNIVYDLPQHNFAQQKIGQYLIDATREFDVDVAASLFYMKLSKKDRAPSVSASVLKPTDLCAQPSRSAKISVAENSTASVLVTDLSASYVCTVYDFYTMQKQKIYGWVDKSFVSDLEAFLAVRFLDGKCPFEWRSGIKHDCSKVMEFVFDNNKLKNGLGEIVDIEQDRIYPLCKSSDVAHNEERGPQKFVLLTQKCVSEDTKDLADTHPKTYEYLISHQDLLDRRKSIIYKKRPRFCLFGIGSYSFKPYKVAISGFYKNTRFALITPYMAKPVMLDDTCYMLGFESYDDASLICKVLNGTIVQDFISSLCFKDAKRPVNKELLMRIDLKKLVENTTAYDLDLTEAEFNRLKALLDDYRA